MTISSTLVAHQRKIQDIQHHCKWKESLPNLHLALLLVSFLEDTAETISVLLTEAEVYDDVVRPEMSPDITVPRRTRKQRNRSALYSPSRC